MNTSHPLSSSGVQPCRPVLEQWRFHNVKSRRTKPQSEPDKATGDWGTIIYSSINFIESQFMQNPGIKDVASHWLGRTMSPFSLYNLDEALKTDVESPSAPAPPNNGLRNGSKISESLRHCLPTLLPVRYCQPVSHVQSVYRSSSTKHCL